MLNHLNNSSTGLKPRRVRTAKSTSDLSIPPPKEMANKSSSIFHDIPWLSIYFHDRQMYKWLQMVETRWNPWTPTAKELQKCLCVLNVLAGQTVGASQGFSASLQVPAKLPSMQSLRWCSITKDSKSGCAIFSAFSLTSKECLDAKKPKRHHGRNVRQRIGN